MELEIIKLAIESGGIAALSLFIMYKMFQRFMGYIETHINHNTEVMAKMTEAVTEACNYMKQLNGDLEQKFLGRIEGDS